MPRRRPSPTPEDLTVLDPDGSFGARLAEDRDRVALASPKDLSTIIHRLSGAAATFGYDEIGDVAMALDELLVDGRPLPADGVPRLLAALDRALARSG